MKTKNKILLFTLILPFILVVMVILSINKSFNEVTVPPQTYSEGIDTFTKSLDLVGFERISAIGAWNIHLIHDDQFKIEIVAPEDMLDELSVEKTGQTLVLKSKKNTFSLFSMNKRPGINITLPIISGLDTTGVVNLLISDFSNTETSISMTGIMNYTAENCTFDQFSLNGTGILNVSMNDTPVTNAHLEYHGGIYNIRMRMNKGRLSGKLDGLGGMIVSGEVFENSIRVKGPGTMKIVQ